MNGTRLLGLLVLVAVAVWLGGRQGAGVDPATAPDGFMPDGLVPDGPVPDDTAPANTESQHGSTVPVASGALVASEGQAADAMSQEAPAAAALAARQLLVTVAQHARANGAPVRVELLFGERSRLHTVDLFVDALGHAKWPAGRDAPGPWLVDFAFPTLGTAGVHLDANAESAHLSMPETCVMAFEVVEVDGQATADALTAEVRVPTASWPANRWRSLPFANGRAELLAQCAGQPIELRVHTASGRRLGSTFLAATNPGERVSCTLRLDLTGSMALTLVGLPGGPDVAWQVRAHALNDDVSLAAHHVPGTAGEYVLFAAQSSPRAATSWLVVAANAADPENVYWGRQDGAAVVSMRAGGVVAVGHVVDASGRGLRGHHVELLYQGRRPALTTAITDPDGAFRLFGPAVGEVSLVVAVQEVPRGLQQPVALPFAGDLVLRVPR